MKLLPKPNLKLSVTTAALSFLAGAALLYPSSAAKSPNTSMPLKDQRTASTSQTTPTTSDTSTSSPDTSTSDSPTTSSPDSTSSPSAGSGVSSSTNTGSTSPSQAQSQDVAGVTAVSATLSDWSAQVSQPQMKPSGTTRSDEMCVWTYSDGSTQSKLYRSNYYNASGTLIGGTGSAFDCTIADAPTPN